MLGFGLLLGVGLLSHAWDNPGVGEPEVLWHATDAERHVGPFDVNEATPEQLQSIHRIGPALAGRIAEHRPFTSVEELTKVPGIGAATLQRIRPHLRVTGPPPDPPPATAPAATDRTPKAVGHPDGEEPPPAPSQTSSDLLGLGPAIPWVTVAAC